MLTSADLWELAFNGIFSLIGLMGNTFIVAANTMSRITSVNNLQSTNALTSSLGVTNICLHCVFVADSVIYSFRREMFLLEPVWKFYLTAETFLGASSLWFATWLCVYYCMKIVNANHPTFIRIKAIFLKNLHSFLIGSVLVSVAISLPINCDAHMAPQYNPISNLSKDISSNISGDGDMLEFMLGDGCFTFSIIQILVTSMAFLIFSSSAGAIIISLYRHMRRMAQNADSFQNPDLRAHVGALKTVTMLLLLYVSFFLMKCLLLIQVFCADSLGYSICRIVTFAFPALSSIILILGNSALRKTLTETFHHIFCCRA
ncbi:taste receptor type 2 member 40-like [Ambystoma mexicanum]|uniref:taste receptor type 2 member 40-like n=1 Tax=Ambystoma mexicanum TaxID=8296 RepID=UPI0037E84FA8